MNFTIRIVTLSIVLLSIANSFANTYGPSVPEVSKFEPFDATNLVDLYTGDFVYTLPLLEIPGSGGGYPLAISYKAGIPTNDQASWVGLGWNLTPGFINRHVAGLPDDLCGKDIINVTKDKFSQSFGGGVKWVSAGGHYDNTQGLSGTLGFKIPVGNSSSSASGISVDFDRSGASVRGYYNYGGMVNASSGVSISSGNLNVTSNTSVSSSASAVSFSVSSTNTNPYIEGSGQAWVFTFSFGQQCGTYKVKSYGHLYADEMIEDAKNDAQLVSYQEQLGLKMVNFPGYELVGSLITDWKKKAMEDFVLASLFGIGNNEGMKAYMQHLYQTEAVVQKNELPALPYWESAKLTNFEKSHMFISKDAYVVNAQGINGAMASYRNKSQILPRTDIFNRTPATSLINPVDIDYLHYNVKPTDATGDLHDDVVDGTGEVNKHQFRFLGEQGGWYTNTSTGYENYGSKRIAYYTDPTDKFITGFSITKEDGVTYHFRKPVYSLIDVAVAQQASDKSIIDKANLVWGNFMNSTYEWPAAFFTNDGDDSKFGGLYGTNVNFNISINNNKYAYAWLLTAVTGPDFVDINNDGEPGFGDLGYWVKFNYNENPDVDNYEWREPVAGYKPTGIYDPYTPEEKLDKSFTCGKKQISYVKSIETNTHIAEFELSNRKDAYACRYEPANSNLNNTLLLYTSGVDQNTAKSVDPFGSGGLVNTDKPLKKLDKIKLYKRDPATGAKESKVIKEIEFKYTYDLCKGTANSDADDDKILGDYDHDGKLTLKEIHLKGEESSQLLPPYVFSYNEDSNEDNPKFSNLKWDRWGFYKTDGESDHLKTNGDDVDAWSLRSIATPMGAKLNVEYESDDYFRVQNRLAEDALHYKGYKVPVEYLTKTKSDGKEVLYGIELPTEIAGRLKSYDRIHFEGVSARRFFTKADYSKIVDEAVDQILNDYEYDGKSGWEGVWKAMAIVTLVKEILVCAVTTPIQCSICPQIRFGSPTNPVPCFTPMHCAYKRAMCYLSCVQKIIDCPGNIDACITAIETSLETTLRQRMVLLMNAFIELAYIPPFDDEITVEDGSKAGYKKIIFKNTEKEITMGRSAGVESALDPFTYTSAICGTGSSPNIFNFDNSAIASFFEAIVKATGLEDKLVQLDNGEITEVLFPFTSSVRKMMGNELMIDLYKLPPADFECPNGSKYQQILTSLPNTPKTSTVFSNTYYPVKQGGGLRVKSISLDNGLNNLQQWNYFYDFLGNGTGVTTGIVPSEPLPSGIESKDDRVIKQEEDGNFYIAAPYVGYEKVTVVGPDGSKVVNEFKTPWDNPYIQKRGGTNDLVHKYTDPSTVYGKVKKKEYYSAGSSSKKVYSEEYQYDETYKEKTLLSKDDREMGELVTAKTVNVRNETNSPEQVPLGTVRTLYDNYLMNAKILSFKIPCPNLYDNLNVLKILHNTYQYDIPAFPLKEIITMQDGATKEVRNFTWDKFSGQPLVIAEKNSGSKWKVTEETPAYHIVENSAMRDKNMLNQVYQTTTYNYSGTIDPSMTSQALLAASTPLKSIVQTWNADASVHQWMNQYNNAGKVYKPSDNTWLTPTSAFPAQIYKYDTWNWNVKPTTPGKSLVFSTSNDQWINTAHVNRYDRYGKELEVSNPNGTTVSIVRGNGNEFVNAEIVNADFKESSIYTGDYDEGGGYLDHDDAWGRGQYKAQGSSTPLPASVKIKPDAKHFGEAGVEVTNAYGPTRAFKLQPQRDYILSAWVKVAAGNPAIAKDVVMGVDYRRHNGDEGWPLNLYSADVVPPLPCTGELKAVNGADGWVLLTMNVPAKKDISSIKWRAGYNYATAWVGVPNGDNKGGNATIYIDDIRFYPKDASVKSYYYDKTKGKPIAFVDENDKAMFYNYDEMGRLVTIANNSHNLMKRFEYSTGNINIIKPILNKMYPVTGELEIKWIYWHKTASLKFYISDASGTLPPETSTPLLTYSQTKSGENSVIWTIPRDYTVGTNYKIKIIDENDPSTASVSNVFFIKNWAVLAPQPGDVIEAGQTLRIEWVMLGASTVDIYYMEDGTIEHKIQSGVPSSTVSSYNWTIPADLPTDRHATIKIVGRDSGGNILTPDAVSGVFTINGRSNFLLKWLFRFQNYR
jgi:hypothetical protein